MPTAFPKERLFDTYAPRVFALARRLCGNEADASDVVQDTFLQAHRRWDTFQGRSDPGTWLFTIAVRRCRRAVIGPKVRRAMPQFSQVAPFSDRTVIDTPAKGPAPWERAASREEVVAMEAAIAELPQPFRVPLVLKDIIELTTEQVAEVMGVKAATVKTRVHRARLLLRARLMRTTERRPAPRPAYPKQVCIDLLQAKLDAMDRGHGEAIGREVVCDRCRAVFAELDLTQNVCVSLGKKAISDAVRALRGGREKNPGTLRPRRASNTRRRSARV